MAKLPKYFYFRLHPANKGTAVEIEDASDVEVKEIVRCKDCKHNPLDTWFECPIAHLKYDENRWCWKGERKDGRDNAETVQSDH